MDTDGTHAHLAQRKKLRDALGIMLQKYHARAALSSPGLDDLLRRLEEANRSEDDQTLSEKQHH